jgi:hypothetical protein
MGIRLQPSHRIRRASGPTRPALGPLAQYWSSFQPEEPKEVVIRLRSAPWGDILDDDLTPTDELASVDGDEQDRTTEPDSPQINLIQRPPPPTWYTSVAVQPAQPQDTIPDAEVHNMMTTGVNLPPPKDYVPVFVRTPESTLMTEVIRDLIQHGLLRQDPRVVNSFRLFLVTKPNGAAREAKLSSFSKECFALGFEEELWRLTSPSCP